MNTDTAQHRENPSPDFRPLSPAEREQLVANGNRAENWDTLLVAEPFFPDVIRNSSFSGRIRLHSTEPAERNHDGKVLHTGICNSEIRDCVIGEQTVIRNVAYCAGYKIAAGCILSDIQEIYTSPGAKFGCGIRNPGEPESSRSRMSLINEAGDRRVPPFPGMTAGDAYLWARYRDDSALMRCLEEITDRSFRSSGNWGDIGEGSIIQGCRSVRNVRTGAYCRIDAADCLEELSIDSSREQPSIIGPGTILRRGIVGPGCRVLDGALAEDFVLASHAVLTRGVRFTHTFAGDNSTIACGEVSNSLIFPFHEQHHNNSFLIASLIMGQSNIAAGATIGSNHNSRSADNELHAARGFWPGLNVSLKHPSRFTSFTLIAKGSYPAELDISLPFSLVSNNEHDGGLEIIPAFWWIYNMYALVRNSRKFSTRDKRKDPVQSVEFDFLAPDTAGEIKIALEMLDLWDPTGLAAYIEAPQGVVERSSRVVHIQKADKARRAYREMLIYHIALTLVSEFERRGIELIKDLADYPDAAAAGTWTNMGGQLVPEQKVELLRENIRRRAITDWSAIHRRYAQWRDEYPAEKIQNAYAHFCWLEGKRPDTKALQQLFSEAERIQGMIARRVHENRNKDLTDSFKALSFRSDAERAAVQGTIDENEFVQSIHEESRGLVKRFRAVRRGLH
ncbi:DUF4954 family protein [Marispirochaeta sp.]|jgi:hypothetical protein|uniref:DUF4954 family protein n=1 Tax=Marispirochaeta sp. TaxID=2038653 RepID=UPI0029C74065|nr:DUF4954 family protein [Marispirochaeta sp.]